MGNTRKIVGLGLAIAIAVVLVVYVLMPKAGPSASNALVNQPQGPSGPAAHDHRYGIGGSPPPSTTVSPPKHHGDGDDHENDTCPTGDTASHDSDHHEAGSGDGVACHDGESHDGDGHGHDGGEDHGHQDHHGQDEGRSGNEDSNGGSEGDD